MSGYNLQQLKKAMQQAGAQRLYVKHLAENDNSKQQVYLGGDFSALNILPYGEVKSFPGAARPNMKASLKLEWLDISGKTHLAPGAQLILYPKYPEIRLSGFLQGCNYSPGQLFKHEPKATRFLLTGRKLFLGVTADERILAYAVSGESELAAELNALDLGEPQGVFYQLALVEGQDNRAILLKELARIHNKGWISSKRLLGDGSIVAYTSMNGGGYTLEAELGVIPNGRSEPDFLGWEVKQYGVQSFDKLDASRITLMTPEPDMGYYSQHGTAAFVRKYGYPDKGGIVDRLNFSSVHRFNQRNQLTGLTLTLVGYDALDSKRFSVGGAILLIEDSGEVAAGWSFEKLLEHWKVKHAQAVYVPSINRKEPSIDYSYGATVRLGEQTDFLFVLKAITLGHIFYDPGIKLENANETRSRVKPRSQFRIMTKNISCLYKNMTDINVAEMNS